MDFLGRLIMECIGTSNVNKASVAQLIPIVWIMNKDIPIKKTNTRPNHVEKRKWTSEVCGHLMSCLELEADGTDWRKMSQEEKYCNAMMSIMRGLQDIGVMEKDR
ncbi:conserved hypothetical protein [Ricinus communis]|uniref:Uncharacterized protein n=1 Tax=Ricinus communis TaxID=3988 RepID=B9S4W6_RICCO|nr:conserved hypothetical protein [Ricinus communis]